MKRMACLLLGLLPLLLSVCVSMPDNWNKFSIISAEAHYNNDSSKYTCDAVTVLDDLSGLYIKLPLNWSLEVVNSKEYAFVDDKDEHRGRIVAGKYKDNGTFSEWKPNHSAIIHEETLDLPIGECKLFTLDVDNGTAASGITGTHQAYYAIIPAKNNVRYVLEFSQNDNSPQTKELFLSILKSLNFK